MELTHADRHPTAGKSLEQRSKQLNKAKTNALEAGQEWRKEHPQAENNEIGSVACAYSVQYMMDDVLADAMTEYFIRGVQREDRKHIIERIKHA